MENFVTYIIVVSIGILLVSIMLCVINSTKSCCSKCKNCKSIPDGFVCKKTNEQISVMLSGSDCDLFENRG